MAGKQDEWTVNDLLLQSTIKMQELNTYKMQGEAVMNMVIDGANAEGDPAIPETSTYLEAVYQQEPLAMYMLQTVASSRGYGFNRGRNGFNRSK